MVGDLPSTSSRQLFDAAVWAKVIIGTYSLRPYNIPVSPILDPKLEVERKWSFQSSGQFQFSPVTSGHKAILSGCLAVAFLMSHGFRIESIFTDGVPYISVKEEQEAMDRAYQDKSSMSLINFDTLAADHAEFIRQVRHHIKEWIEKPGPKVCFKSSKSAQTYIFQTNLPC